MAEAKTKKQKKGGAFTEEDVCTVLQRYSAGTVLALLKEITQLVDVKIDWRILIENTETGIKSAREYQMLWRHLAYRKPLLEAVAPNDPPLDDDSDLEYEVEASPPVSTVDATDASNCVKVLISGSANKSRMPNGLSSEVPRVSLPNPQVQKQSQVPRNGEGLDANRSISNNQKKRKPCLEEEDKVPISTVKREVKGEKNTAQRAQRANTNRKKLGSLNVGGVDTACSPLSQAHLDTRHAIDMALKGCQAPGSATAKMSASKPTVPVTKDIVPSSQLQPCATSSVKPVALGSSVNPCPQRKAPSTKLCPQRKAPPQSSVSADPIQDPIQAAALSAGGRIGSPSETASLMKAAQSKNAVHIRGGIPLVKTTAVGHSSSLPPNVHLSCTGLAMTPASVPTESAVQEVNKPRVVH